MEMLKGIRFNCNESDATQYHAERWRGVDVQTSSLHPRWYQNSGQEARESGTYTTSSDPTAAVAMPMTITRSWREVGVGAPCQIYRGTAVARPSLPDSGPDRGALR